MIDKNRIYKTRDGREVRIYATDGNACGQIHGAIKTRSEGWLFHHWKSDGTHWHCSDLDLIEVRPRHKRTVWLNMYLEAALREIKDRLPNECVQIYSSKEVADRWATHDRIACIKVDLDFAEGDGL